MICRSARTVRRVPVLAETARDERERERLVAELVRVYGDQLDAVWLYGSRARGERTYDESDIDVLVVTRGQVDDKPVIPAVRRVLDQLGNPRIDARQRSQASVEDRRAIDSFFVRDVDRDKVLLHGRP
jgi:predicted nucleotidyltransferase